MTALLARLFSPLYAVAEFFHWDMFNDAADALWLETSSKAKERGAA